jgi:formiminoglutamase
MAWHAGEARLYDSGDLWCEEDRLEDAQGELELHVRSFIAAGQLAIVLGGGHEVACGTGAGVLSSVPAPSRIGIINIDAHFDLRAAQERNSGTSFLDLAERYKAVGQPFNYFCLGISESANTTALFNRATSLDVKWLLDEHIHSHLDKARRQLSLFVESCDHVYLSVDLDVMPSHEAPGVSAPAALGIPFSVVHSFVSYIAASGKLRAVDIAELNPSLDIDSRTARLAARLVHTIVHRRAS